MSQSDPVSNNTTGLSSAMKKLRTLCNPDIVARDPKYGELDAVWLTRNETWALADEIERLQAANRVAVTLFGSPEMIAGIRKMLDYEQPGGDGWWGGWEMVKDAYRKANPNG